MRLSTALLAICLFPSVGSAESAASIEITGYGILANTPGKRVGTGSSGIEEDYVAGDYVLKTTDTIPTCLGTRFGILYRLVGAPVGAALNIVAVNKFPAPGLAMPGVAAPIREDRYRDIGRIGGEGLSSYQFDNQWEMVPGIWAIELWSGDRKLASRDFNVVRVPGKECIASPIT